MYNRKPFDILLDMCLQEAHQLYVVVRNLFDYPPIEKNPFLDSDEELEEGDCEGKLYASAFAFICSDYLRQFAEMREHQDFELFVQEMEFEKNVRDLKKLAKTHIADHPDYLEKLAFDEKVHMLIQAYRKRIKADIRALFPTETLQLRLFSSIFSLGGDDSVSYPGMSPNTDFL